MEWMALAEIGLAVAIIWLTVVLIRYAHRQEQLQREDQRLRRERAVERATPRLYGHIYMSGWSNQGGAAMTLEITNVGEGTAVNIRWWMDGIGTGKAEFTQGVLLWPRSEEEALHRDKLGPGESIKAILAYTAYDLTGEDMAGRTWLRGTTICVRYEPENPAGRRGTPGGTVRFRQPPRYAYRHGWRPDEEEERQT